MPPASRGALACPNCGGHLQAVTLDVDTPPWLCADCARGWWQVETDNAVHWRPDQRDFGDVTRNLRAACEAERAAQHATHPVGPPVKTTAASTRTRAGRP